jgi:TrwC relaxase
MSIHKLSAGSGYDYLTRQVAALDATEKGHLGLASYYTERGETPGTWIGSGLAGLDGLDAEDAVTAQQMRALFGAGLHPLATERLQQLAAADLTDTNIKTANRLGAPFKVYAGEVSPFRIEVANRIATRQADAGQLAGESVSAAIRAGIRTEVAQEFFKREHGRDPIDAREIAATIAKHSRPRAQTVAGYDLTFSPVKSVSTLWAVADPHLAAQIERAHQAAVRDALSFIERHALFTRQGRTGSGRSTSTAWWPRRSRTATPAPAIRICTPTSPSRTKCRPSTDAGCPSTDGCCSNPRWLPRRPTTPPWSIISATGWECGSRTGRTLIRANGRCGRSSVWSRR